MDFLGSLLIVLLLNPRHRAHTCRMKVILEIYNLCIHIRLGQSIFHNLRGKEGTQREISDS